MAEENNNNNEETALVPIERIKKRELPDTWDYNNSVEKVKGFKKTLRNVSAEFLHEVWVAQQILDGRGKHWAENVVKK